MSSRLTVAVVLTALAAGLPGAALAAPPRNDNRADAQRITLPASVMGTTSEATLEEGEPFSSCAQNSASVWYELTAASDDRIVLRLRAAGDLDASIEAFKRTRSQLEARGCDITDEEGEGGLSIRPERGDVILIRVGQRANSVAGEFRLEAFAPQPAARPPGPPLPDRGVDRVVDSLQNPSDAFSRELRSGVTYRVNLATDEELCVALEIYPPGTRSFEDDEPVRQLRCGGYTLYTPPAGEGGRYSFRVVAQPRRRGTQPYHLQVAQAGRDDTAPGIFLGNYRRARGAIRGSGVDAVDLYRFDVRKRSTLDLSLSTEANLELLLLNDRGRRLGFASEGGGIERQLGSGRYFAVVRAVGNATGRYVLTRASRTITRSRISINGRGSAQTSPGGAARIGVQVTPAVGGPVTIVIERFDPLAGWQFFRRVRTGVGAGRVSFLFRPPSVGRWRARATFTGTRSAARSETGFAYLLVAGPLRD